MFTLLQKCQVTCKMSKAARIRFLVITGVLCLLVIFSIYSLPKRMCFEGTFYQIGSAEEIHVKADFPIPKGISVYAENRGVIYINSEEYHLIRHSASFSDMFRQNLEYITFYRYNEDGNLCTIILDLSFDKTQHAFIYFSSETAIDQPYNYPYVGPCSSYVDALSIYDEYMQTLND